MKNKSSISWRTILAFGWPVLLALGIFAYIQTEGKGSAGQRLYALHCTNCHGEQGAGLRGLYPPLAGADYLLEGGAEIACLIRYGYQDSLLVNGKWYSQAMPGNKLLQDQEITALVNYIRNEWGNEAETIPFQEIKSALDSCKPESKN
ncbi:MAG: cytochrome c [Bacteroidota bacterium]